MISAAFDLLVQQFREFTDRYRVEGVLHPMHQLKLEHTLRVAADSRAVAEALGWPGEDVCLAEIVGLFHDIARFPQFKQYRSFSDAATVDHGDLGVCTLKEEGLLGGLGPELRELVFHSVQYHNKRDLPRILSAREEKHLRLIRDADRLDIFFISEETIRSGRIHENPEIMMNLEFNGPPSDEVLGQFERGESIDYRQVRSLADRFVLQLSWMRDLSYGPSRALVRERQVVEKFADLLPVRTGRLLECFRRTEDFLAQAGA